MLKGKDLKKEVFGILPILIICFAYAYQEPILTTEKAISYAALCLYSPPERLGIKAVDINWDDIKAEKFSIEEKSGFYSQLTNRRELNITMKAKNGEELTVRMDAYNGSCLEVTGPLN
ncbi:hypothetical protein CYL18_13590 [Pradoshia eiseniae]|uniref:Uncharacterized protein n=1 Tax=Pradoshia eiseniae TaxID=2064768 RepID=A0A2S7MY42_9BACI|nr:hypothetical protein [Pradoshia eiseniae]PQD94686.1 hypothetical protein CYL18_13590 [Pradoshia eiseniae]